MTRTTIDQPNPKSQYELERDENVAKNKVRMQDALVAASKLRAAINPPNISLPRTSNVAGRRALEDSPDEGQADAGGSLPRAQETARQPAASNVQPTHDTATEAGKASGKKRSGLHAIPSGTQTRNKRQHG